MRSSSSGLSLMKWLSGFSANSSDLIIRMTRSRGSSKEPWDGSVSRMVALSSLSNNRAATIAPKSPCFPDPKRMPVSPSTKKPVLNDVTVASIKRGDGLDKPNR